MDEGGRGGRDREKGYTIFKFLLILMDKPQKLNIIETESLDDLLKYNDKNTLIVMDFDNTLVTPTNNNFGSHEWFEYIRDELGLGLIKAGKTWVDVQLNYNIKHQLMEGENTKQILRKLNKSGCIICTSRGTNLTQLTLKILKAHGIFSTFHCRGDQEFEIGVNGLFTCGVIFAQFQKKSICILDYISKISSQLKRKYKPRVVFIDDSKKHVVDVVQVLTKKGFNCIGIHYIRYKRRIFNKEKGKLAYEKYLDSKLKIQ